MKFIVVAPPAMPLDVRKGYAFPKAPTNPCGFAAASTNDIIKSDERRHSRED